MNESYFVVVDDGVVVVDDDGDDVAFVVGNLNISL